MNFNKFINDLYDTVLQLLAEAKAAHMEDEIIFYTEISNALVPTIDKYGV